MTVYSKSMPKKLQTKATGCHNPEGCEQLQFTVSRSLIWAWIKIRVLLAYAKRLLGTAALRNTAVVLVRKGDEVCPTHSCWVWKPTRHPVPCQVLSVCNITEYPTLTHHLACQKESNQLQHLRNSSLEIAGSVFGLRLFLLYSLPRKKKRK